MILQLKITLAHEFSHAFIATLNSEGDPKRYFEVEGGTPALPFDPPNLEERKKQEDAIQYR